MITFLIILTSFAYGCVAGMIVERGITTGRWSLNP